MNEPKTYRLKKITDLMKVPRDRRHIMYEEIETAIQRAEDLTEATMDKLPKCLHWIVRIQPLIKSLTWIDDGRRDEHASCLGITLYEKKNPA